MNSELTSIHQFFTERRRRCLSVKSIEKEAGIPAKTLDHFLSGRRQTISFENIDKLIPVLVDFGYKPTNTENQFL